MSKDNSTGLRYRRGVVRGPETSAFRNELRYGPSSCPEARIGEEPSLTGRCPAGHPPPGTGLGCRPPAIRDLGRGRYMPYALRSLSELPTTITEELAIAAAARPGTITPKTASGMAITL